MNRFGTNCLSLLILAAASAASAATYHVDAGSGNDGNPGSESRPWKSLTKAAASLSPGDTVLVGPGRYVDGNSDPFRAFNPKNSGTASAPIVFKSLRLHEAELAGRSNNHPAFSINARPHIIIDGFKVVGGIGVREGSNYSIVRNCDVTHGFIQEGDVSLHWGMYISGSSHCIFENNRVSGLAPLGNKRKNSTGLMVIGQPAPANDNLIQNNDIDGGNVVYSAFGQKAGQTNRNVWRRNIARNAVAGFFGTGSTTNVHYSADNDFYENISIKNTHAFEMDHNCRGFRIFGNVGYGGENFLYGGDRADGYAQNIQNQVWNNIYSTPSGTGSFYRRDVGSVNWKLLLSYSNHNRFNSPQIAGWNYKSGSYKSLALWQQATGFDMASTTGIPGFINAVSGDFHLAVDSPVKQLGENRNGLSPGAGGGKPDLGAYPRGNDGTIIGVNSGNKPTNPDGARPEAPNNLPARYYDPIPD